MVEEDLGEATIVYEGPDGEAESQTVQNEHVAYFQDHWILKTGEDDRGRDLVRRIPASRVYHVERTVEQFEEEVSTLRDQVESVADDLRTRLLGGSGGGDERSTTTESASRSESVSIDVTGGEPDDSDESDDRTSDDELGGDDSLGTGDAGENDDSDEDDPLGRNS
ncbi:hypothetical protein M0R88_01265 [Halorussus gelatinilyticus]|uniref:Uncharacterized protein n=1 Tax=Halorussus gelatinilyticus TaxID=2937524 RepID=A0A8U0IJ82_9EURY|nr:hypothetical protein [Halorussus gelatinilyticus]UPW00746.1 hypothetical protein M0R88_01265 [Halorussus gelatinilyticus]